MKQNYMCCTAVAYQTCDYYCIFLMTEKAWICWWATDWLERSIMQDAAGFGEQNLMFIAGFIVSFAKHFFVLF